MSVVRPIYLWVEAVHPESSSVVLDVFGMRDIEERAAEQLGRRESKQLGK